MFGVERLLSLSALDLSPQATDECLGDIAGCEIALGQFAERHPDQPDVTQTAFEVVAKCLFATRSFADNANNNRLLCDMSSLLSIVYVKTATWYLAAL